MIVESAEIVRQKIRFDVAKWQETSVKAIKYSKTSCASPANCRSRHVEVVENDHAHSCGAIELYADSVIMPYLGNS